MAGADVGRAVNPALVDAQLVGGVAFGIGNTLHEALVYDADGQLLTGTLMDYALPYATDVPPVDGFYQEIQAKTNPLGLRGLGECGNPGLGAAIAIAVSDALETNDGEHAEPDARARSPVTPGERRRALILGATRPTSCAPVIRTPTPAAPTSKSENGSGTAFTVGSSKLTSVVSEASDPSGHPISSVCAPGSSDFGGSDVKPRVSSFPLTFVVVPP